jgi:FlaA1/EpsC-like NDP-sugar epimerase
MLNRSWFISGVCGTIGGKLLERVLELQPRQVTGIDNNESELFFLYDKIKKNPRIKVYSCDLRDRGEVESRMDGCEFVLHAAAVKHVIICEESPCAAINSNILGTQNVIDAAVSAGVERLLFTSADKAVNPTNVMGTSKLMAERLVSAANARTRRGEQVFASTRFGNVLGSRGSVIPLFVRQIRAGGPVTLTSPQMSRFIMTLDDAVRLVLDSLFLARGGEIFVTKMPVVRIGDLAEVMIEELAGDFGYRASDIAIEAIGPRPGEKMYEELMNDEEINRSIELANYFVIRPAILSIFRDIDYAYPGGAAPQTGGQPYNSKNAMAMTKEELRAYLRRNPTLLRAG